MHPTPLIANRRLEASNTHLLRDRKAACSQQGFTERTAVGSRRPQSRAKWAILPRP